MGHFKAIEKQLSSMKIHVTLITVFFIIKSSESNSFKNEQFTNNPGIYFENISPLFLTVSQWNLVTYYNISDYEQNYAAINLYYINLKHLCDKYQSTYEKLTETCTELQKINFQTINKINEEHEIVQQYLEIDETNYNTAKQRTKRSSYFGGIGKLQRILFGVLTEEEGEIFEDKIKTLEEKQIKTLMIQKEQIKIFKSSLDSVEEITSSYTKIKDTIDININKLNNELKIQKDELKILNIVESILLYNSLYTELLNQYAKDTTLLLNIITNAHKGQVNPQIIKPNELLTQLKDIKTNLPSNLNLPIEINAKSYFDFMKLIDLNIFYVNHLIIFVINIPLTENIPFNLYHIISLPVHVNKNDFVFIQSTHEFIAVEKNKQSYIFFTQNQINKCKTTKQKLICESNMPISNNIKSSCEFQLFTKENNMPENCEIKTVPIFSDLWHQLGNSNRWIYATHKPIELIVSCQDEVENIEINKAGILSLNPNCKAFTKNNIILAKYLGRSNFSKDYVPQFHLSKLTEHFNDKIRQQQPEGENQINLNTAVKFNDLKIYAKSMSTLDEQITNELSSKSNDKIKTVHSVGISTIALILTGIILFKIIKSLKTKNKTKPLDTVKVVYDAQNNQLQVQDNTESA